jgi:hypothetical protein
MAFGLTPFTIFHVVVSLVAIGAGLVVLRGLLTAKMLPGWTAFFLLTTAATSVTGFFFPFHGFTPAFGTGIASLVLLALAIYARYAKRLAGGWRTLYVIGAVLALHLNIFVLIVNLFRRIPALSALAPTQAEPTFLITQLIVLGLFIALIVVGLKRFRPEVRGTA